MAKIFTVQEIYLSGLCWQLVVIYISLSLNWSLIAHLRALQAYNYYGEKLLSEDKCGDAVCCLETSSKCYYTRSCDSNRYYYISALLLQFTSEVNNAPSITRIQKAVVLLYNPYNTCFLDDYLQSLKDNSTNAIMKTALCKL